MQLKDNVQKWKLYLFDTDRTLYRQVSEDAPHLILKDAGALPTALKEWKNELSEKPPGKYRRTACPGGHPCPDFHPDLTRRWAEWSTMKLRRSPSLSAFCCPM